MQIGGAGVIAGMVLACKGVYLPAYFIEGAGKLLGADIPYEDKLEIIDNKFLAPYLDRSMIWSSHTLPLISMRMLGESAMALREYSQSPPPPICAMMILASG